MGKKTSSLEKAWIMELQGGESGEDTVSVPTSCLVRRRSWPQGRDLESSEHRGVGLNRARRPVRLEGVSLLDDRAGEASAPGTAPTRRPDKGDARRRGSAILKPL